jgi:glucose/mannose-6-phosphate isomerase
MSKDSYLKSIYSYPEQFKQAWDESTRLNIPEDYSEVGDAIISGMGASIFGGLALQSVFSKDKLHLPLSLLSDYNLPEYADEKTLLVTTSYSGNTEETLSTFEQGADKGCKMISITSGGKLRIEADKLKIPNYIFNPKNNPSGAPRTAVGYTIGATLGVFSKLGFLDFSNDDAKQTYNYMRNFVNVIQRDEKMPAQVAQKILGRIPIFVSAEHLTAGTHIWRNFLNETSKHVGFTYEIPNMNHHFLDGLFFPRQLKDDFIFIFVMSKHYSEDIKKRFEITREITKKAGMLDVAITLGGHGKLNELLELIVIGSLISFNISSYHKADPSTNEMVDYLKASLAKRK